MKHETGMPVDFSFLFFLETGGVGWGGSSGTVMEQWLGYKYVNGMKRIGGTETGAAGGKKGGKVMDF